MFTQLISSHDEMREGDYWYLLLMREQHFVIYISSYPNITENDEKFKPACFLLSPSFDTYSFEYLSLVLEDAALTYYGPPEKLKIFKDPASMKAVLYKPQP